MFTEQRLNKAYKDAKRIKFNHHSKYVFFSDLHRGDDSVSDEFTRNQHVLLRALQYYYEKGYTYVEAGDGDELWEYPDFKHIRMAHADIFSALKKFYHKDRMIMLYGNHNIYLHSKWYVRQNYYRYIDEYKQDDYGLFPGLKPYEAIVLEQEDTGQEIFVVHGHQGDLMNDQLWVISMLMLRYFWRYLHVVGFRNPASPSKNLYKRHKIEKTYRRWIQKYRKILICGHTHRPRFPKGKQVPYFNTGCCIRTKGLTGIELQGNKIQMVDWHMTTNEKGTVKIEKTVVRGPEDIRKYNRKSTKLKHIFPIT